MSTNPSVAYFEAIITAELSNVSDAATLRLIDDLLPYAKEVEKEAENRELRPRPDGSEDIAYYRNSIDYNFLPTTALQNAITALMNYIEDLEKQLADAS